jgi:hypothetical protein
VSDIFRHRNETGKSYCRTRFDEGSERVNPVLTLKCKFQLLPNAKGFLLLKKAIPLEAWKALRVPGG